MKFNFEQLGGIDKGMVELGDLTVICGPNNMGKTYISYAIYGLLRHFKRWIDLSVSQECLIKLRNDGTLLIELTDYQTKLVDYLKSASSQFSESLPSYFNVSEEYFNGAKAVSALESASVFPKISSSHLKSITSSLDFHHDHSRTC